LLEKRFWKRKRRAGGPARRRGEGRWRGGSAVADGFFDLDGFLADAVAEIVETGAADAAAFHDFDLGDLWSVDWEDPFDAFAVADFADGEGLADALAFPGDDDACEELDAFFAAFEDSGVDLDGVTDAEVGDVGLHLFALNLFKLVHKRSLGEKDWNPRRTWKQCTPAFQRAREGGWS